MIVYAVEPGGRYVTVAESLALRPEGKRGVYVNLTNQCTCACTFCLRSLKDMAEDHSLWLAREPSEAEVRAELSALPWELVSEIVFCGFGEPTMRLETLTNLLRWLRAEHMGIPTRLNTNGLSDLFHGRDTAPDFDGLLDVVSISLNASNAERYLELTRSRFGLPSFEAMLAFAERAKAYVPDVVLTVVDHVEDDGEIARCRAICEARGLRLRVRPYEAS
ncbi:MAG: TatD family nuclease-associated radical SAM protein [Schwartzia sp.]|nr:radical SAM protein [Schwartzia sp. (in: firmicutes)]MBR1760613.1 TatD family nuclease-associated radical SAM protein [Schwartzia sp. (in: firmicutes)]MBR1761725.1 TatD family nuclease-associated radical SAM protein [Schwartzia sp. (in: firmicutes)]MBR1886154.1 TatD family nuclease-associated radical SAM protein [Schwartzia sp. (in: firmicutes)]